MPAEPEHTLEDDIRDLAEGFVAKDTSGRFRNIKTLALLAHAIDQIDFSVLILDLDFHIVYANATAARTSEYPLEEIVGARASLFGSGWHSRNYYDESERTVKAGVPWHGYFINRRKFGDLHEEDATISPIFDEGGTIIAYVVIKRDITGSRHVEKELSRARFDQETIGTNMRGLIPGALRETAQSFCDAVVRTADIDVAIVFHALGGSKIRTIAATETRIYDPADATPFDSELPRSVFEQLEQGPVRLSLTPDEWPGVEALRRRVVANGAAWVVLSPIRFADKTIGVLALASRDSTTMLNVDSRIPFFEQLGLYAGVLFGYESVRFEQDAGLHDVVTDIIDAGRFTIVFQPIVDLITQEPVGYEALTRFHDEVPPAQRFADAHIVGLGSALERATATAALEAAASLPEDVFVTLNFSAEAILDGSARAVVRGAVRNVVIEITEHDIASDYAAVRQAISAIEGVELAVDDMGAGYTSLHQVIELLPGFVKLDISIIQGVERNPVSQALIEAICHFAASSGVFVIAEGVETHAEAEIVKYLGRSLADGRLLGQGYLFGFPEALHKP
ncbi:MAG: EAL domain-containing protein [Acidimicrobiales bacterium]